jgi:four helix bundle protein
MFESYRDLVAWQKAMNLVEKVYSITAFFPDTERFGLVAQLRRAAVSIPSALAEGRARGSTREFSRYVSIARGSLAEVETQLVIAERLGLVDREASTPLLAQCDEQGRVLRGLKKSLDNKISNREGRRTLASSPSSLISSP